MGGTAGDLEFPFDDGGAGGSMTGFLQYIPPEFTREELRGIRNKARELANGGFIDDNRRELLEDMADIADILDALTARDKADLKVLEEQLKAEAQSPTSVPRLRVRQQTHHCPCCVCPPEKPRSVILTERYGLEGQWPG